MKKFFLLPLCLLFLVSLAPVVSAAGTAENVATAEVSSAIGAAEAIATASTTATTSADGAVGELLDGLPEDLSSLLPEEVKEEAQRGGDLSDKLGPSFLLNTFFSLLGPALKSSLSRLSGLLGVLLLAALLEAVASSSGKEAATAARFASGLGITLTATATVLPVWRQTEETLRGIGLTVKSALPVMTSLCAASGNLSSATVNATWLTLLLSLIEELGQTLLAPLLSVCLGLLAAASLSRFTGAPDLSGILSTLKKTFTVLLSLLVALLGALLTFQSVLAKRSDGMLLRSIRFAAGNMIPVVGNALGEAAGSYLAGVGLVKGSVGLLLSVSLILYLLPVFLNLFLCRAGFSFLASAASLFGCPREGEILRETGGILDLALALLASCALLFLLAVLLFAQGAAGG